MRRHEVNTIHTYLSYAMGSGDFYGLGLIFKELGENSSISAQDIFEIGYNSMSGYTFVALENGIEIVSQGKEVEFLIRNFDDGEEYFFATYKWAEEKLAEFNKINFKYF